MIVVNDAATLSAARRVAGRCTMIALYVHARQPHKVEQNLVAVVSTIAMEQDGAEPVALGDFWS